MSVVVNILEDGTIVGINSDELQEMAYEIPGATMTTKRVSMVEPDEVDGKWYADLAPLADFVEEDCGITEFPKLGPFDLRGQAIKAEIAWLNENYIHYDPESFKEEE